MRSNSLLSWRTCTAWFECRTRPSSGLISCAERLRTAVVSRIRPLKIKEFAGFVENIFRDPFQFHSTGIVDYFNLISRGSPVPRSNAPLNIKEYKEFMLPEQDCP